MQIYFDNMSLTTDPYSVKSIDHNSATAREINMFNLARQRGGVLVNAEYRPKSIIINGIVSGDTIVALEQNIDILKELTSRQGKNLDIDYAGSVRRYEATAVKVDIQRDFFNLTYAPYTIEFIVPSGIGRATSLDVVTLAGINANSYVNTIALGGTTYPRPNIKFTITAANTMTKLEMLANGDKITINRTFAVNDVVVIDCDNMQVTVNGIVVDYTGIFPNFGIGANIYDIEIASTSCTYTLEFSYYKFYI